MRKRMQPNFITNHLQEHSSLYIFHTVLFLMGIIFGAIVVNSMSLSQQNDLYYFLSEFFQQLRQGDLISAGEVFKHTLSYNSKFIGLMWILGISMIGLPFILVLLFLKGLVVGFTIGFLVQQMGWQGFLLSIVSVLPQNIIIVPIYIFVAVISVTFSLQMIKKLFVKSIFQPFGPMLTKYILQFGFAIVLLVVAGFIEGYFTPYLMKSLLNVIG